MKRIPIIILILLAAALVLTACVNNNTGTAGYIPTLASIKIERLDTDYVDEENTLCLEITQEKNQQGQSAGAPVCEQVKITVNFLNKDKLPIISLKVNDDVYTADKFTADINYTKITLLYRPKPVSGDYEITVHSIYYKKSIAQKEITNLSNNTKTVRIAPEFTLTIDLTDSLAKDGENIVTEKVVFMDKLGDLEHFYSDREMSYKEEDTISLDYCKKGYAFAGWFTEPGGNGKRLTDDDYYEFYTDITVYAYFECLYQYEVKTDDQGNEYAKITGLTETGKNRTGVLKVYDEVDGYPIRELGENSLRTSNAGVGIELSDNVEVIGNGAFMGYTKKVSLGVNIKKIGNNAFNGCTGLEDFYIPSSVTEIGDYAFMGCVWNTVIDQLGVLEKRTQQGSTGKLTNTLIIPATLEKLGKGAFKNSGFTTVYFWENSALTEIGEELFMNSSKITTAYTGMYTNTSREVKVSESLENLQNIPSKAFYDCVKLQTVNFAEGLQIIGASAFSRTNIENLTFPDSLTEIGGSAFSNYKVKSINFKTEDSRLAKIGEYAFEGAKVFEVDIKSRIFNYYGISPFYNSQTLRAIWFNNSDYAPFFDGKDEIQSLNDAYVKYLVPAAKLNDYKTEFRLTGNSVWGGYWTVELRVYAKENIYIEPNTQDRYGYEVKSGGTIQINFKLEETQDFIIESLTAINIGGTVREVTSIGMFAANENVKTVKLPHTIEHIGDYAFSKCEKLESVNFATLVNLKTIGEYAFNETRLASFTSNATLESIGRGAFLQCPVLIDVKLIKGYNLSVGIDAFNTSDVRKLWIGKNVKKIGDSAFAYNRALGIVYIDLEAPPEFTQARPLFGPFRGAGTASGNDIGAGVMIYLKSEAIKAAFSAELLYEAYKDNYKVITDNNDNNEVITDWTNFVY